MKIRLMGTEAEIASAVKVVATVLDVQEVSDFYPNRGTSVLGRVYLDAVPRGAVIHAKAERRDQPPRTQGLPAGRRRELPTR